MAVSSEPLARRYAGIADRSIERIEPARARRLHRQVTRRENFLQTPRGEAARIGASAISAREGRD